MYDKLPIPTPQKKGINWENTINFLMMAFTGVMVILTWQSVKTSNESLRISAKALEMTKKEVESSDSSTQASLQLSTKSTEAIINLSKSFQENLILTKKEHLDYQKETEKKWSYYTAENIPNMNLKEVSYDRMGDDNGVLKLRFSIYSQVLVDVGHYSYSTTIHERKEFDRFHIYSNYRIPKIENDENCLHEVYGGNEEFTIQVPMFSLKYNQLNDFEKGNIFIIIDGHIIYKNLFLSKEREYVFAVKVFLHQIIQLDSLIDEYIDFEKIVSGNRDLTGGPTMMDEKKKIKSKRIKN